MNLRRYIHGWSCWWEGFRGARRKKHGAGPQRWSHALKTAACFRHIADGQHCDPPRIPRYLRRAFNGRE
jgi:hypothetical protein